MDLVDPIDILSGGPASKNFFFLDLETTGTNFQKDHILEIGVIATSSDLIPIGRLSIVVHHDRAVIDGTSEWHRKQFGTTLLKDVASSTVTLSDAATSLGRFFDTYRDGRKVILAGSSVAFDRLFLQYHMPDMVRDRLHYRVVDVSSIMECVKRWMPRVYSQCKHRTTDHRALADAEESLNDLRFYYNNAFKTKDAWTEGSLFTSAHAGDCARRHKTPGMQ